MLHLYLHTFATLNRVLVQRNIRNCGIITEVLNEPVCWGPAFHVRISVHRLMWVHVDNTKANWKTIKEDKKEQERDKKTNLGSSNRKGLGNVRQTIDLIDEDKERQDEDKDNYLQPIQCRAGKYFPSAIVVQGFCDAITTVRCQYIVYSPKFLFGVKPGRLCQCLDTRRVVPRVESLALNKEPLVRCGSFPSTNRDVCREGASTL